MPSYKKGIWTQEEWSLKPIAANDSRNLNTLPPHSELTSVSKKDAEYYAEYETDEEFSNWYETHSSWDKLTEEEKMKRNAKTL